MPKHLREIASLKGVKSSTIKPLDLPDDIQPNKDGKKFVSQHSVEKHEDRVGNGDDVYKGTTKKAEMARHGLSEPMQKIANEETIGYGKK